MTNESNYLQEIQTNFRHFAKQIRELDDNDEAYSKNVMDIIRQAIDFEKECRADCQLGARFNVIPNQIKALFDKCEDEFDLDRELTASELEKAYGTVAADEITVYIYLFNARVESSLKAWGSLVAPMAIKNYSVNRPIYKNQFHIDELIRNKPSPAMHAYLEVIIKESDIILVEGTQIKDSLGNPLVRVKENTITFERICYFHYLGKKYKLINGTNLQFIEA